MKINESQRISSINSYRNSSKSASVGDKKGMGKDELRISDEAKELLQQNSSQRVESLKSLVSSGTYQVDARKVADKLFPFVR